MDVVLFVLNNSLAVAAAVLLAEALLAGREAWRRRLAALATFPLVVLAAVLVAGALGRLTPTVVTGILAVLVLVAAFLWGGRRASRPPPASLVKADASSPPADDWKHFTAAGMLAGLGTVVIVQACLTGTAMKWDDLKYHAPAVAHWLADGRLSLAPMKFQAYFPYNADLVSLWFVLPFRADAWASLSGLYWLGLAVAAAVFLARRLGASRPAAILCAALLLSCPVILSTVQTFAAVDLAGPAALLAAIALAVPPNGGRWGTPEALYSGLLAGFAAGVRVSLVPGAVVLLLAQVLGRRRPAGWSRRAARAGVFLAAAAAMGAFWYARNWILTGNPLYPAEVGPFEGPFHAAAQSRTRLIHWILMTPPDRSRWLNLLKWHTDWPFGLAVLAGAGYLVAVFHSLRRRSSEDPAAATTRLVLLAVGLSLVAAYPWAPFSGARIQPDAELRVALRFLVAPFAIGIILFSVVLKGRTGAPWWGLAILCAVTAWPESANYPATVCAVLGAGVGLWLGPRLLRRIPRARGRRIAAAAAVPLGFAALALLAPWKQHQTDEKLYTQQRGVCRGPIAQSWRFLEGLPAGARVTWLGPGNSDYYPLFGRKLDLVPCVVDYDGRPYRHLHERPRHERAWWAAGSPSLDRLADNLAGAKVEYVLVTRAPDGAWTPHRKVLLDSGRATLVEQNESAALLKLSPNRHPVIGNQ